MGGRHRDCSALRFGDHVDEWAQIETGRMETDWPLSFGERLGYRWLNAILGRLKSMSLKLKMTANAA